jgi:hypothetical protein
VFGAQAEGKAHTRSDLDVSVLLEGDPDGATCTKRRLDILGNPMRIFCANDVDVVVMNQADLVLRHQVVQYGRLAYEREHLSAIESRVRAWNTYFDFAPFLKRMEQAFYQRIREGRVLDGYNPYHARLSRTQQSLRLWRELQPASRGDFVGHGIPLQFRRPGTS